MELYKLHRGASLDVDVSYIAAPSPCLDRFSLGGLATQKSDRKTLADSQIFAKGDRQTQIGAVASAVESNEDGGRATAGIGAVPDVCSLFHHRNLQVN